MTTNLNLQKKVVKNTVTKIVITTIFTLVILLPVSIILHYKWIEWAQNHPNVTFTRDPRILLLPITLFLFIFEIRWLFFWVPRYSTFRKINFPSEEIKTVFCKKISLIRFFSVVGLKIKTEHDTFIYISGEENEALDIFKKELLHKTIQLKCYRNTNIVKKMDKKIVCVENR